MDEISSLVNTVVKYWFMVSHGPSKICGPVWCCFRPMGSDLVISHTRCRRMAVGSLVLCLVCLSAELM